MSIDKRKNVEGLYCTTQSGKRVLIAQMWDGCPADQVAAFFRIWRARAKVVGDHRLVVKRSTKAIID